MKKNLTIFLLLAMTVVAVSGCRSKCAPLDRTYPSHQENTQAAASQANADDASRVKIAMNGCENKNFAFAMKEFIGG